MTRLFASAVAIGLVGFCTAAQADPLIIQPTQEFAFDNPGYGGLAVRGDFLLAGLPGTNAYPPVTGAVNIYRKKSGSQCTVSPCWVLAGQLTRPDSIAGDGYGTSIDFDEQTLLIGSPAAGTDPSDTTDYAAAYVYEIGTDGFVHEQKLQGVPLPANPGGPSHFGIVAKLAGNRLALTQLPTLVSGSAYVFKRNERGVWHQEAQLQPAAIIISDQFGVSVDLDDDTLISGSDSTGYATLFYRKGDNWTEGPTLRAPDQAWNNGGAFGRSVALHDNHVWIGAPDSSDPGYVDYIGSEYVFKRDGQNWTQQDQIKNPGIVDPLTFPQFGAESVHRDGRLAIASIFGIVLYERQDKQWVEIAELVLPSPEYFSILNSLGSVAMDRNTLVAETINGIAVYDLSSLNTQPATTTP
jgi:hypothetical protein